MRGSTRRRVPHARALLAGCAVVGIAAACGSSGAGGNDGTGGTSNLGTIPPGSGEPNVRPDPFNPGVPDASLYEPMITPDSPTFTACTPPAPTGCTDADGDSFGVGCPAADCDDTDPTVFPGAPDLPGDGVDQDCAGDDPALDDSRGIFVVAGMPDTNAGTQAAPVGTVAKGIELAEAGSLPNVFVAGGIYDEDVISTVSLYAGFESVGWTRDTTANVTHINVATLVGTSQVIDGFTVSTFIGADGPVDTSGCAGEPSPCAGIQVRNNTVNSSQMNTVGIGASWPRVAIRNNVSRGGALGAGFASIAVDLSGAGSIPAIVEDNTLIAVGTGVQSSGGTAIIRRNRIDVTSTIGRAQGVGLIDMADATISHNRINVTSDTTARGIEINTSEGTVFNNVIRVWGEEVGTSVDCRIDGTMTLAHNTFVVEAALDATFGVRVGNDCSATIVNNLFAVDASSSEPSSIGTFIGSQVAILGNSFDPNPIVCLVRDNGCIDRFSALDDCSWEGCLISRDNIDADPMFVDASIGDFHLDSGSGVIDQGVDPIANSCIPFSDDIDGDGRPARNGYDIGADELP